MQALFLISLSDNDKVKVGLDIVCFLCQQSGYIFGGSVNDVKNHRAKMEDILAMSTCPLSISLVVLWSMHHLVHS